MTNLNDLLELMRMIISISAILLNRFDIDPFSSSSLMNVLKTLAHTQPNI